MAQIPGYADPTKCSRTRCHNRPGTRGLCHKHYGQYRAQKNTGYVEPEPIRQHIAALAETGLTYSQIGRATGVCGDTVVNIAKKRFSTVQVDTARRLLAMQVPARHELHHIVTAGSRCIESTGTQRRVQALVALGYTQRQILAVLCSIPDSSNWNESRVAMIIGKRCPTTVAGATAREVEYVYERLSGQPPRSPAVKSLRRAKRHGWVSPLAWDAETIDDPAAEPYRPQQTRRGQGCSVPSDFIEIVADHRELGRTDVDIAERLGITYAAFEMRIRRAMKAAS